MKVESVPIATLSQDPANARKHDDKNLEAIKASLRRFGQQKPIVVDSSNVVRAGNGTLAAATALGWESINVVQTNLQGSEATAYAIADNRTAELAEWDDAILESLLQELRLDNDKMLLDSTGFSQAEIEEMCSDVDAPEDFSCSAIVFSEVLMLDMSSSALKLILEEYPIMRRKLTKFAEDRRKTFNAAFRIIH